MVLFDSTFALVIWLPGVPASVPQAKERVEHLINELHTQSNKIIIPTPVISELLVGAGQAGPQYLLEITKSAKFKVAPFDTRAAVEAAAMLGTTLKSGKKKGSSGASSWPKTKFDHQIVAIGIVEGADTVYTDDEDLGKLAAKVGLKVVTLADLPLPPARPRCLIICRPKTQRTLNQSRSIHHGDPGSLLPRLLQHADLALRVTQPFQPCDFCLRSSNVAVQT